jgi:hypothetical protein
MQLQWRGSFDSIHPTSWSSNVHHAWTEVLPYARPREAALRTSRGLCKPSGAPEDPLIPMPDPGTPMRSE